MDDYSSGQRGHGNLKSRKANLLLALREPIEELVPGLEKPYAITCERQGAWGPPLRFSAIALLLRRLEGTDGRRLL